MVRLQPAREIVPGGGNEGVLASEVLDDGLVLCLQGEAGQHILKLNWGGLDVEGEETLCI